MLLREATSGQRQVFPEGAALLASDGDNGVQLPLRWPGASVCVPLHSMAVLTPLYLHPAPAPGDTVPERPLNHLPTPTGHVIFSEHFLPMLPCCPQSSYLGRLQRYALAEVILCGYTLGLDFPASDLTGIPDPKCLTGHSFHLGGHQ